LVCDMAIEEEYYSAARDKKQRRSLSDKEGNGN
jgi:hypothetical protein